jgi:intracellular multiplication protein IcmL
MSSAAPTSRISLTKKGDMPVSGQPASVTTSRVDSLALVLARNAFYHTNYQKLLWVVLGQIAAIVVLVAVLDRLFEYTAARDYYFPVQTDNTLILERPLYEPVYTDEEIRNWAEEAVTRTMTFGYYDYLMRWQASRGYFTLMGWASFTKAMENVSIMETIGALPGHGRGQQVIVTQVHPGRRPEIRQQGIVGYQYAWDISMPVDVTFFGRTRESRYSWNVEIRIVRLPTREGRFGRGISQLIAERIDDQAR